MWKGVIARFQAFHADLLVGDAEINDAVGKAHRIGEKLQEAYWGPTDPPIPMMIVGSWGKNTQVRPSNDIDMMVRLPDVDFYRFDAYASLKQSALLQEVKNVLSERWSQTDMRGDGQVVAVKFNSIMVEVVPVFLPQGGGYFMPDTRDGGSWKYVDPQAQIDRVEVIDALANRNVRPITRMMKLWIREKNIPLKSFVLELLVADFFETYWLNHRSWFYFDFFIRDFLVYLLGRRNGYVSIPGTGEYMTLGESWVSRAETALAVARTACDYEYHDMIIHAGEEWQKMFGTRIPAAVGT